MEIVQEMGSVYLCVADKVPEENQYLMKMLINNYMNNILSCRQGYRDNINALKYDISNMKSLHSSYEHTVMEFEKIKRLIMDIAKIQSEGRAYLLEEEYYIMDPRFIFTDLGDDSMKLLYIPYNETDTVESKGELDTKEGAGSNLFGAGRFFPLADFLLEKVDHRDEAAVKLAYDFYRMSKEKLFSIDKFIIVMDKYDSKKSPEDKAGESRLGTLYSESSEYLIGNEPKSIQDSFDDEKTEYFGREEKTPDNTKKKKSLFGRLKKRKKDEAENELYVDNVTVDDYWGRNDIEDATEFFDIKAVENCKATWYIKGREKRETIMKYPAILGKKREDTDVFINDPSVSRRHLSITCDKGKLYIEDLNSTNGTFLNGEKIKSGEKIPVTGSDKLQLGNVPFTIEL